MGEEQESQIEDRMTSLLERLAAKFTAVERSIMLVASEASAVSKPGAWKQILHTLMSETSEPSTKQIRIDKMGAFLEIADTVGASGEALSTLRNLVASF